MGMVGGGDGGAWYFSVQRCMTVGESKIGLNMPEIMGVPAISPGKGTLCFGCELVGGGEG
jgi:hypothetical protein